MMHALERTNPKGEPFVGRCRLCGKEELTTTDLKQECPNPEGKGIADVLVEAIEGTESADSGEQEKVNEYVELQRRTEHLEYCSPGCSPEHKEAEPDKHKRANCLLCGTPNPNGHVMVYSPDGLYPMARVCSSHTLRETILGSEDRWTVHIQAEEPDDETK